MSQWSSDLLDAHAYQIGGVVRELDRYVVSLSTVGRDLDADAKRLADDSGWQGEAADAFRARWERDGASLAALIEYAVSVRGILATLVENLSATERAFEAAVRDARAAGLQLGPNLEPPPVNVCVAAGRPIGPAQHYADQFNYYHYLVDNFRYDAAGQLCGLHDLVATGDGGHGSDPLGAVQLLGDLYISPTEALSQASSKLTTAQDTSRFAHEMLKDANKALHQLGGGPPVPYLIKNGAKIADSEVATLEGLKSSADSAVEHLPFSKQLGMNVGEFAEKFIPGMEGLSELDDAKYIGKAVRFLEDLPLIDVAAGAAGTYVGAQEAMANGDDPVHATAVAGGANAAGIVVGGLVTGAIIVVAGPELVVGAAAVVAGGVTAIGVTDFVTDAFDEHWDEDFADYGPGALVVGPAHVVGNTVMDTLGDVGDLGGAVLGVFGL